MKELSQSPRQLARRAARAAAKGTQVQAKAPATASKPVRKVVVINFINSHAGKGTAGWVGHALGCADIEKTLKQYPGTYIEFQGSEGQVAQDMEESYADTGWQYDHVVLRHCLK